MNKSIELGDIVSFGWKDGYDSGTVYHIHKDGAVDVFRPYTHTTDFSSYGSEDGSSAVMCYVGVEKVKGVNPSRITLLRKGVKLR
jgi:hypothetical protein